MNSNWLCWLPLAVLAAPLAAFDGGDWKLESIVRGDGREIFGVTQDEQPGRMEFVEIVRPAGKPMYLVVHSYSRKSVTKVNRIAPEERQELLGRIRLLLELKGRARIEAGQVADIVLRKESVNGQEENVYDGEWFRLESSADVETTARCVVRIEQIFRAYRLVLPARAGMESGRLTIRIFGSMDDYRGHLQRQERAGAPKVESPAFYSVSQNLIVAGSDLGPFSEHLQNIRREHLRLNADYDRLNGLFAKWRDQLRDELLQKGLNRAEIDSELELRRAGWNRELKSVRDKVIELNRRNDAKFAVVTERMFVRLYHEAFHAYLENFLYPHREFDVPRWLNEGLAQLFESGQLDGDTLRIDAPLRDSLRELQTDLARDPLPLAELLTARPTEFLVTHEAGSPRRHYVYSWGLVYYLAFHQNLLDGSRLQEFMSAESQQMSPIGRFERLVRMSLPEFEQRWRREMRGIAVRR